MRIPRDREHVRGCGPRDIVSNTVITRDGKLRDVLVRIAESAVFPPDSLPPPRIQQIVLDRVNCVHVPRIQGVMVDARPEAETTIRLRNSDQTLHAALPRLRKQTVWGQGEPKGAAPVVQPLTGTGIYVLTCSIHRWERAFVVATPHPYFDVTGDTGTFSLESVPPGSYEIEAWHSRYGWKRQNAVVVTAGDTIRVDFTYSTSDPVPEENSDELFWD